MHLNQTAALMAFLTLEDIPKEKALRTITRTYRVSPNDALIDYAQFCDQLDQMIRPDEFCPIHDLDIEVKAPFSTIPTAPYRMDLAITYRCNNDCKHCYNARPRNFSEIPTEQWKSILNKLWDIGIPHVVFTGGEPTLRDDLPELISHAEKLGQITGLNTNGRRLSNKGFIQQLVDAGLDHVQITVESHDPTIHNQMVSANNAWSQTIRGLENALDTPLYVMTNTTMLDENSQNIRQTLEFLAKVGVPTIGLNALIYAGKGETVGSGLDESQLRPILDMARKITTSKGQRLIWYTPTQYCNFDPVQLDLGVKGCTAALYNMCIEPDGNVLPCQSYYEPLGNLINDDWDSIWNHELALSLRERKHIPPKCTDCSLLQECGGGCPLKLNDKSNFTMRSIH
jgi:radical SAM protein with 4Fe4S-binding SPASM domain